MSACRTKAFITLTLLACLSATAGAQSVIRGTLRDDESGKPIEAGLISLLGNGDREVAQVRTNDSGVFIFPALRGAAYRLRAQRIGYRPITTPSLKVPVDNTIQVEIRISTTIALLAPLKIVAQPRRESPLREGFVNRKALGLGVFVTREEIEKQNPLYVTDILGTVSGVRLGAVVPRGGRQVYMARSSLMRNCPAQIYLDGFLVNRPLAAVGASDSLRQQRDAEQLAFTIDDVVSPSLVESIEVYRGLSEIPAEFAGHNAQCGVIVVWTRSGR